MKKSITDIQKEIACYIKKRGFYTIGELYTQMGVKGEINMHRFLWKPLRVSCKTKVLAVAIHIGPDGAFSLSYLLKERGKEERWSLLGEPLKFKGSVFQMKRILNRLKPFPFFREDMLSKLVTGTPGSGRGYGPLPPNNKFKVTVQGRYEICKTIVTVCLQIKSVCGNLKKEDIDELKRLLLDETKYHKYSEYNPFIKKIDIKADQNSITALINLANAVEKTNWETIMQDAANDKSLVAELSLSRHGAINNPDGLPKEMDPFITPITSLAFELCKEIGVETSIIPPYESFRKRITKNE